MRTITQSEARLDYGEDIPVGRYIAVIVVEDLQDGEETDMLVGIGAAEADALADAEDLLDADHGDIATYLVVEDEES